MEYVSKKRLGFKDGAVAALPIVIGYIPAAMAFGLLAKSIQVSLTDTFLFSVMVFAGASQYMALNLIAVGAAAGEIIVATFLLNLRHALMSASLAARLEVQKKSLLPLIAFGVTDEAFSVAATREERPTMPFMFALEGVSYSAWVGGSVLGYLVGSALPASVRASMGIALYAMFVAILVPEMKKSVYVAGLALGSGLINAVLSYFKWLPSGWNMVAATVLVAAAGAFFIKDEKEVGEQEEEVAA
ncbi:MAG: AzlC family ABC transporter permease [Clostridia bacterium]|nr:AzlC family ABC transporter permease [Clostridia bacterium]